jgi:hypothetical protein
MKAICDTAKNLNLPPTDAEAQKKRADAVKKAMKDAIVTINGRQVTGVTAEQLQNSESPYWRAYWRGYLTELKKHTAFDEQKFRQIFDDAREFEKRAVARDPHLSQSQKSAMIQALIAVNPPRNYADLAMGDDDMLTQLAVYCGSDGMSLNAVNHEGKEVRVCPAYFSDRTTEDHIFGLIGHELGHTIDAEGFLERERGIPYRWARFPVANAKTIQCYRDYIKGWHDDYYSEVTADYWMTQTIAEKLEATRATPQQVLESSARRFADYCSEEKASVLKFSQRARRLWESLPGGRHPDYLFRIGITYARDPHIRKLLGCQPVVSAALPACTTGGLATSQQFPPTPSLN